MSKSILEALYHGKLPLWERKVTHTSERTEIEQKIQFEKDYFKKSMTADDYRRLEKLESLYTQASEDEVIDMFIRSFAIGAFIMLEITAKKEDILYEEE
jgi:hypothetical protein